ncbi:hypothetical protein DF22_003431, partial [Xylella fastidiosa]
KNEKNSAKQGQLASSPAPEHPQQKMKLQTKEQNYNDAKKPSQSQNKSHKQIKHSRPS